MSDHELPDPGTPLMCLICACEKPWGVFAAATGAAVCIDCRDRARATTTERERLRGECERLRPAANAWNALFESIEALCELHCENDRPLDEKLNAYIDVYCKQKAELTTLREQLATAEREIPDSLIGWTITAAFADGSFRVQSPIGEVKRVTFFRNEAEAASAKGGA